PGLVSLAAGCILALRCRLSTRPATASTVNSGVNGVAAPRRTQITVFAVICLAALFGGLVFNAVTVSVPKFLDERLVALSGDLSWIGASAGMVFAVAAFAQLPVGELLDRFGARLILIGLVVVQILLLASLSQLYGWPVMPLTLLLVTMMFAEIPITSWLLGRYVQSGLRSRAVSVEYVLSLGMGSVVVPLIAGMHGIGLGFDFQFVVLAAAACVVLVAACFLPQAAYRQVRAGYRHGPVKQSKQ
ncbi:MAG: hypothetical protein ACR2OM_13430, partial [Aestuariivirgaceae bacterium]